jgi:hypothetical protein
MRWDRYIVADRHTSFAALVTSDVSYTYGVAHTLWELPEVTTVANALCLTQRFRYLRSLTPHLAACRGGLKTGYSPAVTFLATSAGTHAVQISG